MDLQLAGKIALVGGGSDGIGYGIARELAREGCSVALMARRLPALEAAASRLQAEITSRVIPVQGDCRKADDITRAVDTIVGHFGGLDILINNDGAPPLGELSSFDDVAWSNAVERNLMYVVRASRAAIPHMKARGGGSILNIISGVAVQPKENFGLCSATWAGVLSYAKTLAIEVGKFRITVNTIMSGLIETPRAEKVVFTKDGTDIEAERQRRISLIPVRRVGQVGDIGALAALLVSPRGSFISGTAVQVDGGILAHVR